MLFYSANAGHFVHIDDPGLVIASILLVLADYDQQQNEKQGKILVGKNTAR